eukprot:717106-Rhodomonas_salina.1
MRGCADAGGRTLPRPHTPTPHCYQRYGCYCEQAQAAYPVVGKLARMRALFWRLQLDLPASGPTPSLPVPGPVETRNLIGQPEHWPRV